MTAVVVGTADLRAALAALRGHLPAGQDAMYGWIRAEVTGPVLQLTVTDLRSAAIGIVSILENEDGEAGIFELLPSEIAELLLAFKAASGEDEIGPTLRIDTTRVPSTALRFTDISGLWPGKSISFPRASLDPSDFPDVATLFGRTLARTAAPPERIITHGPALAAFAKAAAAYGQPLLVEGVSETGRTLLVSCGESFLGLLISADLDEDQQAQVKQWREAWTRRLPATDDGEGMPSSLVGRRG